MVRSPDCQSPECEVDKSKSGHPAIKNLDTKSKPRPNDETGFRLQVQIQQPSTTGCCDTCILILKSDAQPSMWFCCDEPYVPYDAIDGCIMTVVYGVNPYRTLYRSVYVSSPNGMGTVAVIRMPSGHRYSNGVQP